jgi:YD repeat-containing protein
MIHPAVAEPLDLSAIKDAASSLISWVAAVPDGTSESAAASAGYAYTNDRRSGISHNGFNYDFTDDLGNRTAVSVAGQNLVTYDYEPRTGRLNGFTYGNGQAVSYEFDPLDRVSAVKFNDSVLYRYAYDASGNVGYHEDLVGGVNYRYIYDLAERLVRITDSRGRVTAYDYDANNNVSLFTEKISGYEFATAYGFDRDNRPTAVSYSRGLFFQFFQQNYCNLF